jgi:hypothetical protein
MNHIHGLRTCFNRLSVPSELCSDMAACYLLVELAMRLLAELVCTGSLRGTFAIAISWVCLSSLTLRSEA